MKNLRICIAGPSGTGKTTLAKYIAETYKIPFITTSTKPLWEKHSINSHAELISRCFQNPQWGLDFQKEVLDWRVEKLYGKLDFVTDRSPLCNLTYFLMQNSQTLGEAETESYINDCVKAMNMFRGMIQLPFIPDAPLEADGMRIANQYYQKMVNACYQVSAIELQHGLDPKIDLRVAAIKVWDWDTRIGLVDKFISRDLLGENLAESHEG